MERHLNTVFNAFETPEKFRFTDCLEKLFERFQATNSTMIVLSAPHRAGKTALLAYMAMRLVGQSRLCCTFSCDKLATTTESAFSTSWRNRLYAFGILLEGPFESLEAEFQATLTALEGVGKPVTFLMDEFEHFSVILTSPKRRQGVAGKLLGVLLLSCMGRAPSNVQFVITGTSILTIFTMLSASESNATFTVLGMENLVSYADYSASLPSSSSASSASLEEPEAEEQKTVFPVEYQGRKYGFESLLGYPGHILLLQEKGMAGHSNPSPIVSIRVLVATACSCL